MSNQSLERLKRIDGLIDKVSMAASSEKNLSKGQKKPFIAAILEEPIASTILFNYDARDFYSDPLFYVEQSLIQKLWKWENIPDDMPINTDISAALGYYSEYTFLGMDIDFNKKGVPNIQDDHPISQNPDLSLLKPVDFKSSGWMPRIFKWYEDIQKISDGRLKVGFPTWWRGCLDLAIQLRGFDNFIIDTIENPDFIHDLLKFITQERNNWYNDYCSYFNCEMPVAYIGDDWLNCPFITPDIFSEFVLPRYLEVEKHHGSIGGIHSCGNQTPIQKYLLEIKSLNTFEVGPWSDLTQSLINIPEEKNIYVAVHPNDVLYASVQEMEAKLKNIAELCSGRKFSLGTSGLTPVYDDNREYVYRINKWLEIAFKVFGK